MNRTTAVGFLSAIPLVLCVVVPATGQQWEVEVHGGGMLASKPGGDVNLPGAGASFTTISGTSSRRESSWYFGDGASLLNEVNAARRATGRITPLDTVLTTAVLQRQDGGSLGFRIGRRLNARFGVELSLEYNLARLKMSDASLAGIEATRASFVSAWNGLLANPPFTSPSATSTATIHDGGGRQVFATGVINIALRKEGRLIPYVTLGAGLVSNNADAASVTLAGNYEFGLVIPTTPTPLNAAFRESDTVMLRYTTDEKSFVGVLGLGLKYHVSSRWGVRGDLREHLSSYKTSSLLDASPSVATFPPGTPAATLSLSSSAAPAMQFSNFPSASGGSTLSGPPITGFQTFKGTGKQSHFHVVVGVFLRF